VDVLFQQDLQQLNSDVPHIGTKGAQPPFPKVMFPYGETSITIYSLLNSPYLIIFLPAFLLAMHI
jgi:hypothetical protein